jgi:2,3-bisphosphoglycerate-independent phosphoglycerate mutase
VTLCVLDGWGWREARDGNAVRLAGPAAFDALWAASPHALLTTHGPDVGLPPGQFGNSEVGHLNLGAGRVVMQDLPRIDAALADGSLAAGPAWRGFTARARAGSRRVHLLGLVSPGGVHAHQDQIAALARLLAEAGLEVRLHAWSDGRDTPPRSAAAHLARLEAAVADLPGVRPASLCGGVSRPSLQACRRAPRRGCRRRAPRRCAAGPASPRGRRRD